MSNQARLADGDACGVCEACRSGRLNHGIPATMERAVGPQADGESNAAIGLSSLAGGCRIADAGPGRDGSASQCRVAYSTPSRS